MTRGRADLRRTVKVGLDPCRERPSSRTHGNDMRRHTSLLAPRVVKICPVRFQRSIQVKVWVSPA